MTDTTITTGTIDTEEQPLNEIELRRVCRPREVSHLTGMSWDSFRRLYPDRVVKIGKRMCGARLRDVLTATIEAA